MKVLFVTREGCHLSGARVRCYNFARELTKHGIEASVFSFAENLGAAGGERELGMSAFERLRLNARALLPLFKEPRETLFVLQRVNYHVLAPLFVAALKKNRFLLDCDDWNIREDPVYHFGFYPSSKMEGLTRWIARRAARCLAASVFLTDYIKQWNPRTNYLPTGVDTELFRPQPRPESSRIVFSWTGTAYHPEMGENLRFLLDCFSAVADRYGHVFLSFVGAGRYYEAFKREVSESKHGDRIEVRDWIAPDKVPEYLLQTDVGLLPLIQHTKFNCAKSPTKLFEFMSMARPVVCSDRGEASLVVRDGENGLLARDREEFVSGMCRLVRDPALRERLGQKAREEIEKYYSLKALGEKLAVILKDL